MLILREICETSNILRVIYIFKNVFYIACIAVPIIYIFTACMSLFRVVTNGQATFAEIFPTLIKRLIASITVFLLPTIMTYVFSFVGNFNDTITVCLNNANLSTIEKFEEEEAEERAEIAAAEAAALQKAIEETEAREAEARENIKKYNAEHAKDDSSDYDGETLKILLIGNSYTYYNGYGQILAKLGEATGKSMIVVRATKGSTGGTKLGSVTLSYVSWSSTSSESKTGSGTLSDIANIDFGSLDRAGSWDYIILQNNDSAGNIITGDKRIYKIVSNMIESPSRFIINGTTYGSQTAESRTAKHVQACQSIGCSVMNTGSIFGKYSSWKKNLTIQDDSKHPSGRGQYLNALVTYARIFGTSEFATSSSSSTFIELYNSDGGTTKEFASNYYKTKNNATKASMSVTKKVAKELQALVYNNSSLVYYY